MGNPNLDNRKNPPKVYEQGCHMVRKSGKTNKNDKSQVKMGFFGKSQKNKFFLTLDFVSSNLPNSLYLKTFEW